MQQISIQISYISKCYQPKTTTKKGAGGVCSSKAKTSLIKINIFFYILFHNLSKQEHISHHRAKNEESKQPNLCMIFFLRSVIIMYNVCKIMKGDNHDLGTVYSNTGPQFSSAFFSFLDFSLCNKCIISVFK